MCIMFQLHQPNQKHISDDTEHQNALETIFSERLMRIIHIFVLFWNDRLSAFNSEHYVYVKLGIVSTMMFYFGDTVYMSPLWGFRVFVYPVYYTHVAPLGLWGKSLYIPLSRRPDLRAGCVLIDISSRWGFK